MSTHNKEAAELRKYGRHLGDCLGGLSNSKRACTCGFDAALTASEAPDTEQAPPLPDMQALPVIVCGIAGNAMGYTADQVLEHREQYAAWKIAALRSAQAQSVGNSDELTTVKQSLMVEQASAGACPSVPGVYAWHGKSSVSLVMVNKRPSSHSPGGVLNGHVMKSCDFYDGCPVEQWTGGRWFGPLNPDAALSTPPAVPPELLKWAEDNAGRNNEWEMGYEAARCHARGLLSAAPAAPQGDQPK